VALITTIKIQIIIIIIIIIIAKNRNFKTYLKRKSRIFFNKELAI